MPNKYATYCFYNFMNSKLCWICSLTPSLLDLTDIKLDAQSDHTANSGEILNLTSTEIQNKKFHLKYDVITDTYSRLSDNSLQTEEWLSLVKEHHNIKRLEDKDAKMVCLARSSKVCSSCTPNPCQKKYLLVRINTVF